MPAVLLVLRSTCYSTSYVCVTDDTLHVCVWLCRVIRGPIPWHEMFVCVKKYNNIHLFLLNPMMLQLQQVWCSKWVLVWLSVCLESFPVLISSYIYLCLHLSVRVCMCGSMVSVDLLDLQGIVHGPISSTMLCLRLPLPSFSNCTWNLLHPYLAVPSRRFLVVMSCIHVMHLFGNAVSFSFLLMSSVILSIRIIICPYTVFWSIFLYVSINNSSDDVWLLQSIHRLLHAHLDIFISAFC